MNKLFIWVSFLCVFFVWQATAQPSKKEENWIDASVKQNRNCGPGWRRLVCLSPLLL